MSRLKLVAQRNKAWLCSSTFCIHRYNAEDQGSSVLGPCRRHRCQLVACGCFPQSDQPEGCLHPYPQESWICLLEGEMPHPGFMPGFVHRGVCCFQLVARQRWLSALYISVKFIRDRMDHRRRSTRLHPRHGRAIKLRCLLRLPADLWGHYTF